MKIALIKETKTPVDNRVALAPKQVAELNRQFPQHQIVVQASDIRAFSDDEYRAAGVEVVDNVSDADILFGIKEAKIESLIPNKQEGYLQFPDQRDGRHPDGERYLYCHEPQSRRP